jgi:methyl-accepting chemotaxis protein
MNLPYELSKIKDAFRKVRDDMQFITQTISENYTTFMNHHRELSHKIEELSSQLQHQLHHAKEKITSTISDEEIHNLKLEIKELKEIVSNLEKEHTSITHTLSALEKDKPKTNLKEIQDKIEASELELYLLKERMIEKDLEVKQLKDINQKLFEIVNSLAKTEMQLLEKENGIY